MSNHVMGSPSRISRRTALGGIGALGAAVALGLDSPGRAVAQSGTPGAALTAEDYPEVVITASRAISSRNHFACSWAYVKQRTYASSPESRRT